MGRVGRPLDYVRLHNIWKNMLNRCYSKRCSRYSDYGGRGIFVCGTWKRDFEAFCEWALDNGYKSYLTLDRRNNDRGYAPWNCQWVTYEENTNNRRNTRKLSAFGELKTLQQWTRDKRCKVNQSSLYQRIESDWNVEEAITTPPTKYNTPRGSKERFLKLVRVDGRAVVDRYIDSRTPIKAKCKLHNKSFKTWPHRNLVVGYIAGCPECSTLRRSQAQTKKV